MNFIQCLKHCLSRNSDYMFFPIFGCGNSTTDGKYRALLISTESNPIQNWLISIKLKPHAPRPVLKIGFIYYQAIFQRLMPVWVCCGGNHNLPTDRSVGDIGYNFGFVPVQAPFHQSGFKYFMSVTSILRKIDNCITEWEKIFKIIMGVFGAGNKIRAWRQYDQGLRLGGFCRARQSFIFENCDNTKCIQSPNQKSPCPIIQNFMAHDISPFGQSKSNCCEKKNLMSVWNKFMNHPCDNRDNAKNLKNVVGQDGSNTMMHIYRSNPLWLALVFFVAGIIIGHFLLR